MMSTTAANNLIEVYRLVVHCKRQPYDVYIGRPSEYGNKWSHKEGTLAEFKVDTIKEAVDNYEVWVLSQPEFIAKIKRELKGKRLGCWGCNPCHGYILARIANTNYPNAD